MKHEPALLTIFHDPSGEITGSLAQVTTDLANAYTHKYVLLSEETHPSVEHLLTEAGFHIRRIPKRGVADARRRAAKWASVLPHDYYHYCDLDRLVTWFQTNKQEIPDIKRNIVKRDYTIIGRKAEAFASHPVEWQETEKIANRVFSIVLGKAADITAGSCGFSKRAAELITSQSDAMMTDGEWPMLILNQWGLSSIGTYETAGLQYLEQNKGNPQSDIDAWTVRLKLAYIISDSISALSRKEQST
ncbi:hypothetical protein [Jeotgalibacillus aurantiacus]|uniref:hypothetical protein n=1 Tax=Jeotgalibacillus aurantiacus TaxID=2763266 RepID=UPI001D0B98F1|nr:hypothetical protein [Jeotgalibacillus aurantiacus]